MRIPVMAIAATVALAASAHAQTAPASPVGDAPSVATIPADRLARTEDLIGRTVVGQRDERIGEVSDVLADVQGNARVLVIDLDDAFDSEKEVGVAIEEGRVALHDDWIAVEGLTRDDVAALPGVEDDEGAGAFGRVSEGGGQWPAGLAPLPGWFAEPQPDME